MVELAEKGSKGAKLGKAIINLADYCKDGLNEVKEVPLGRRSAVMLMALQCEWLRLNKKTIVKVAPAAPQPIGLAAVSVGSEQLFLARTGIIFRSAALVSVDFPLRLEHVHVR